MPGMDKLIGKLKGVGFLMLLSLIPLGVIGVVVDALELHYSYPWVVDLLVWA